MNHFEKITLLCSLLLCNVWCNAQTNQAIIDKATQYDLDLTREQQNLPETVRTNTLAGKKLVEPFLSAPTDSIDMLHKRQHIIRFMLEQDNLLSTLQEQLATLATHEQALELEHEKLSQQALQQVYFTSERLQQFNTSPYALDVGYALHITGLCLPAIEYMIFHAGINVLGKAKDDHGEHGHHDHDESACGCSAHVSADASNLKYYGFHALILAMHIAPLYHMVEDVKNRAVMLKLLQEQMIHVGAYITTAQEIFSTLKNYHSDLRDFKAVQELGYFFAQNPACSPAAHELLQLLKESTFTGEPSLLNHVGNVLAAYKLYMQTYQEFGRLTHALAEIDLYVAAADIMKNQTHHAPWCFVDYKQSSTPSIIAKNMRHLFVPDMQSKNWDVDNSMSVHTFITGENGSGKSTYINGIGHALVFAQTFGIAPAQEFEITPFSHICTYRHIQDNIAAGTSRFYAECARIEEILNTVTESSGLSCVLLDEPFTSTNAQKGSDFLAHALSTLFKQKNCISFTASHFTDLKTLTRNHSTATHLHLK